MTTTAHLSPHFVKRDWSAKQLMDYLKSKGVAGNRQRMGQSNVWLDDAGNIVAQVTDKGVTRTA